LILESVFHCISVFPREYPVEKIIREPIFIRNFKGKILTIYVDMNEDVSVVKYLLQDKEDIPHDQQRISYVGKTLKADRTLASYGIQGFSTIHLSLRLRGGMYHFTSGRQNFEHLPTDCTRSIEQILIQNPNNINLSEDCSLEDLQRYSLEVQSLLSSLYSTIGDFPKSDDIPDLKQIISPLIGQQSDQNSDDDEE
jgi:hypothetical protein